jgi:Kdo2-lipid IVA lauroyltransferase/acyltransferase
MRVAFLAPNYWPTWLGLGGMRVIAVLPFRLQLAVGRVLGRIVRRLPLAYVRIARRNMELCLPELSAEERNRLLGAHFENLGIGVCETANTWWSSEAEVLKHTQVVGAENLQAALRQGRGAILVGGHFTTIEIATRMLNTVAPVNVLYRPTKNLVLAKFLYDQTAQRARRAIPYDDIRAMVRALKQNEVVWYAPDQSYRNKGAEMVPFFGIPAATTTATSRLARISGAAVLTYFPERLPDIDGYRVVIGPALENFPSDDPKADAARFNSLLEAHILKVPDQYLWMHRRFKGLSSDYPDYYGRDSRLRSAPTAITS